MPLRAAQENFEKNIFTLNFIFCERNVVDKVCYIICHHEKIKKSRHPFITH